MVFVYFLFFLSFTNSFGYKIIDLEPYRYTYYVNDILKSENNTVIYKFQPQSDEKNIFISFLGNSKEGSFEFYLYSNISDINYDDNTKTFLNYTEKLMDYGEINIEYVLDTYYILVKMNSYEDIYKYLSFMMYNLKESCDIGKYNDYIFAFEGTKEINFNYPAKNIHHYIYIKRKGKIEYINYSIFKNNTNSDAELVFNYTDRSSLPQYFNVSLLENNDYYIKVSIKSKYMIRFVIYFLDNMKNIIPIKDHLTDIKYGDTSFDGVNIYGPVYFYFFINLEKASLNELIGYKIFDPFNSQNLRYAYKYYSDYNISGLPRGNEINNFNYDSRYERNIKDDPIIYFRMYENVKGLLLKIESYVDKDNDYTLYNENIVYLYSTQIFELKEK